MTVLIWIGISLYPRKEVFISGTKQRMDNYMFDFTKLYRLSGFSVAQPVAVEYNGQQHYKAVDFFGGVEGLSKQQELDERKATLCSKNRVRLIIVRFDEDMDVAVSRIQSLFL
jgi:hypothetical protein